MRVALIGYGPAGAVLHAPLIAATPGLELAAIVTSDPTRRAAASAAHPGVAILPDVDEVWRSDVGLVVVATPNRSHVPLATRAIDAGIPVVVEKPLASSAEAAARIVDLAHRRAVPLTVFNNRRWDSDFLTVQQVVDDGRLGRVHRVEARFEAYRSLEPTSWQESPDPADGGGVLLDLGSHRIDQALLLLGRPSWVVGELHRRRTGARVEDDAFLSLAFPGGIIAQLWLSRVARSSGPGFRIVGADATFEIDGTDPQWSALGRGRRPGGRSWGRHPEPATITRGEGPSERVERVRPVAGVYEAFYDRLRDALGGEGPVPVDPADAVAVLHVIEAARRSAEERRAVAIDWPDRGRGGPEPRIG